MEENMATQNITYLGSYSSNPVDSLFLHGRYIRILNAETRKPICTADDCELSYDRKAKEIYRYIEKISCFFQNNFGMNGVDGKGTIPHVNIHWQNDNAQWGIACEGGTLYESFTFNDKYIQPDIVAHEYMHAVISHINPLNYQGESGALNESLADVIGTIFKQCLCGQTANNGDWKIGNLRSLSLPPLYNQPAHMSEFEPPPTFQPIPTGYQPTPIDISQLPPPITVPPSQDNDFWYVHTNSGIPNHAFFLSAMACRGNSWETIGQIWFKAFLENANQNSSIENFARLTGKVALLESKDCFPIVKAAWQCVGISI